MFRLDLLADIFPYSEVLPDITSMKKELNAPSWSFGHLW